jgi:hypothetical protein
MNPTPNTSLPSDHNFTNAINPPNGYQLTKVEENTSTVAYDKGIVVTKTFIYDYKKPSAENSALANRITPMGRNTSMGTSSSGTQLGRRIRNTALNVLSL